MAERFEGTGSGRMSDRAPANGPSLSNQSIKWVATSSEPSERGAVVVNADATTVTDSFPSKPLNFVMIFGPSKSGKSFFMNALARRDGIFRVSNAAAPCTNGVDLSKTVVSLREFMGTTRRHESSETMPYIGFVDVEGLGDRNPDHHVKLAIPPMLVSKVLEDNWGDDYCRYTIQTAMCRPGKETSRCLPTAHLTEVCQYFPEMLGPDVGEGFGCLNFNAFHHAKEVTHKRGT